MPRYNAKNFQLNIVSDMHVLCHFEQANPWSVEKVAKHLCNSNSLGISLHYYTCKRWYNHWLDFGMLLCETPGKYKRHGSGVFDVAALEDLKLVVDNNPVLYLDEISK